MKTKSEYVTREEFEEFVKIDLEIHETNLNLHKLSTSSSLILLYSIWIIILSFSIFSLIIFTMIGT